VIADTFPPGTSTTSGRAAARARQAPRAAAVRNVVVVVLESTGARYLSLYGSRYATTPHLQAESAHAVVYDRAYAERGLHGERPGGPDALVHPYMTWREYTQEHPDFPGAPPPASCRPRLPHGVPDVRLRRLRQPGRLPARPRLRRGAGLRGARRGRADQLVGRRRRRLVDRTSSGSTATATRPFYATVWTQQAHHPYDPGARPAHRRLLRRGGPLPPTTTTSAGT
jgi:hypothetical protein